MAGIALSQFPAAGSEPAGLVVRPTTLISIMDHLGKTEIGYITGFDQNQTRQVMRIRVLSAKLAGRTIQQVPQPVDFTLTVNGFYIYKQSPGQISGNAGEHIIGRILQSADPIKTLEQQKYRFNLVVKEYVEKYSAGGTPIQYANTNTIPDSVGVFGQVASDTSVYRECQLISSSTPRSIENAFVTESATIQVGWISD